MNVRGKLIAVAIAAVAGGCGGKTDRDFSGRASTEPSESGGSEPGGGGEAATGGLDSAASSANAGAGGSAGSPDAGGSGGIDWSEVDWEPIEADRLTEADCSTLSSFAGGRRIAEQPARQVLFSNSLSHVVLRLDDAVLSVALPSGEANEAVVAGVASIEWLRGEQDGILARDSSQHLLLLTPEGTVAVVQGPVCGHVVTPDLWKLYAVHDCDGSTGTLSVLDEAGVSSELAEEVPARTLLVSPDGSSVAYLTEAPPEGPCPDRSNQLHLLSASGEEQLSLTHTAWFLPQFLANGLLLTGRVLSCDQWELLLYVPRQDALVPLGSSASPSYHPWEVSLSGRFILGEQFDFTEGMTEPGQLVAVSLTGEGERVLASDLFLYHAIQIATDAYHPFSLTADGRYAVYVSGEFGRLSAVPMDGGAPTMLSEDSSGYSYRLSPFDPDQIVFVNRVGERPDQTDEVRLGSVNAGTSRLVYSTESATALSTPPELAFLPDGRGLLLLDELSRLLFVPSVGQPLVLAENVSSFQSDPSGCVAAYVSDQPEPGTYLVLIP